MSTQTYKEDYYFTEEGVALPIRWCSPETLNVSESVIETKKVNNKTVNIFIITNIEYLYFLFRLLLKAMYGVLVLLYGK